MLPNIQQNLKPLISIFQLQRFLNAFTFSKLALWLHLIYMIRRKEFLFLLSAMLLMGEVEFFGTSVYVYRVTKSRHIHKNNRE